MSLSPASHLRPTIVMQMSIRVKRNLFSVQWAQIHTFLSRLVWKSEKPHGALELLWASLLSPFTTSFTQETHEKLASVLHYVSTLIWAHQRRSIRLHHAWHRTSSLKNQTPSLQSWINSACQARNKSLQYENPNQRRYSADAAQKVFSNDHVRR